MQRRDFHKTSGAFLLSYLIGGTTLSLSPAEAKARKIPYHVLTEKEANLISLIGEAIVPGAAACGLSHFIDHQLSVPLAESMLIAKYLGVPDPQIDFYRPALTALDQTLHDKSPEGLKRYIEQMMQKNPEGWENAPPAPFFYFVLRSDAVDVTYGTQKGFEMLDIPYLAHIEPSDRSWA